VMAPQEEPQDVSLFEKPMSAEERIRLLRSKLQEAVGEEDYEAAAGYRDEIRALENEAHTAESAGQNEGDKQ